MLSNVPYNKVQLLCWTDFFQKQMEKIIEFKVLMALPIAKINNETGFKDNSSNQSSLYQLKKKKVEYWGIYIEIVKS